MNAITFSIVIPSYNQQEYLPQAIESVLRQKRGVTELIIVDDGSTDGSKDVATYYEQIGNAERVPTKLISQVNKGLASARNTGIMNATSDYIIPLDADDYLEPDCVEKIYNVACETDADVIAPSIRCFGVAEQVTHLMPSPNLEDFKVGNRIAYCAAIKRKALLEVGGYSPRMAEGYEDLHLWINLLTRGKKIVTIPEPLMNYRVKEESMWKTALKHHDKLMVQIKRDFPNYEPQF